jgi:RHS repeat-associated protein
VRYTTPNSTLPTRYTYTGQYSYINDEATDIGNDGFGLMFYNARWYDPALGRFAQADSIVPGGVQGLDRYAYVSNNPLKYIDPSGHRPVAGCGDEGKNDCYEDDAIIRSDNAAKLATLENDAAKRNCASGNKNYCSGWDNWAWKNIPSAFGVQGGVNVQSGVGLEASYSVEASITFNWRSGQIAGAYTTEPGVYFGTPTGASVFGYGGVHAMKGISNLKDLSGPDAYIEGSLESDTIAKVGLSVERSQSLVESGGPQYIDPVSQMPQDTLEVNIGGGADVISNVVEGGITIGESNSVVQSQIIDLYDWFEYKP